MILLMFVTEIVEGGGGVLGCVVFNGVLNIMSTPLTYLRGGGKILGTFAI